MSTKKLKKVIVIKPFAGLEVGDTKTLTPKIADSLIKQELVKEIGFANKEAIFHTEKKVEKVVTTLKTEPKPKSTTKKK
jgi:hypothetical protein